MTEDTPTTQDEQPAVEVHDQQDEIAVEVLLDRATTQAGQLRAMLAAHVPDLDIDAELNFVAQRGEEFHYRPPAVAQPPQPARQRIPAPTTTQAQQPVAEDFSEDDLVDYFAKHLIEVGAESGGHMPPLPATPVQNVRF